MAKSRGTVYELHFRDDGRINLDGKYIHLPSPTSPYVFRISIPGASALASNGVFKTNYPLNDVPFKREVFHSIELKITHRVIELDLLIDHPGSFAFYIEYDELPEWDPFSPFKRGNRKKTECFNFAVDPCLKIKNVSLSMKELTVQSVIGKWMGPFKSWDKYLERIAFKEYKMIHFTPLQVRGASNSPYSLFNQLDFSADLFTLEDKADTIDKRVKLAKGMTDRIEKDYGMLSLTDVVWNHTAHNSDWLLHYPEAAYNLHSSPHLEAACELDTALLALSADLHRMALPTILHDVHDLLVIMEAIKSHVIGAIRLWEYYVLDSVVSVEEAISTWMSGKYESTADETVSSDLVEGSKILLDRAVLGRGELGQRYHRHLDISKTAQFIECIHGKYSEKSDVSAVRVQFSGVIDETNLILYREYDADVSTIMEQLFNRIKYMRIDDNGPKLGEINKKNPLIETYFTRLPLNDITKAHPKGSRLCANNGWIWANNPLEDFAGPQSKAYLLREVIVWGDCVKLRYGESRESNPWLWDYMGKYTKLMAEVFHGFRIDNCHSTPLHVASYLLDLAREVRPDLYVVAELFTGSEAMDIEFVSKLGLSSLIREAMQAWDAEELSRLVHRHSYRPVGSIDVSCLVRRGQAKIGGSEEPMDIYPLRSDDVHALFMDCTHDNETPAQRRTPEDALPTAALVCMSSTAIGSVMGFDELYPKLLNLVTESRKYSIEDVDSGIVKVKRVLNKLHLEMEDEGFTESHVHHEGEYITVHRVAPQTGRGYFLIARTAFDKNQIDQNLAPIHLEGTTATPKLCYQLKVDSSKGGDTETELHGYKATVKDLEPLDIKLDNGDSVITMPAKFPLGSIAILETQITNNWHSTILTELNKAEDAMEHLDLLALNIILYRCEEEERDSTNGEFGAYNIPDIGRLCYCGLQGWRPLLEEVAKSNDLGHPLCENLRQGLWSLEYVIGRLKAQVAAYPTLQEPITYFEETLNRVKVIPRFLVPKAFATVILAAYTAARSKALHQMSPLVNHGDKFLQHLSLVSVQLQGTVTSASLDPKRRTACMAAGLPHFSHDYMRTWGRDTFISLRGLFLVTGRYEEAREHILGFASTLKHGLIPNLLDSALKPRYNARDAVWFFLQSLQDYTKFVKGGNDILQEKVKRRFPLDDTLVSVDDPRAYATESTILEIIQEIFERHAQGIHYREANAGFELDSQMSDRGFNVDIEFDADTGMIFGGSEWNCGTWQDKMGSSSKAGNKGVPATPRNGAPIELTGLLKSALRWIVELQKEGIYKWDGVKLESGAHLTFEEWNQRIQKNFERCYYVPKDMSEDRDFIVDAKLVNRRGIYKDIFKSSEDFKCYQFRANFPIAMVVAPELFDTERALYAVHLADKIIRGPLGMRTLDPSDSNYRGYYNNSDDSDDYTMAGGFSYHQGPEWVWNIGYFLRAFLLFDMKHIEFSDKVVSNRSMRQIYSRLARHRQMIREEWAGLVELTNKDGADCRDSCNTQAWSAATILDTIYDLAQVIIHRENLAR